MPKSRLVLLIASAAAAACSDLTTAVRSTAPSTRLTPAASAGGVELSVTGSGHVIRNLGAGDELTTFSYSANRRVNGETSGQFQYNFR
ncbi:MAG TPA: hypothetical protein VM076_23805, partial [Gemmatimonadaceae bacterium]|nr:hypothetical protein [Gemmatimonadaceae bacterium]